MTTKKANPKKNALSARALAVRILSRVAETDAYLNVVIDSMLDEYPLADSRDKGFVTELCYGTTRRLLTVDALLKPFSNRKLETLEDRVLAALRIGAYQHVFLKLPAHAVVADTVQALKELRLERATGFVNAILRKITAGSTELPTGATDTETLALRESHPVWLVERWVRQFGLERASVMLQANNVAPPLVLRTNTSKISRDELLAQLTSMGVKATATATSPIGLTIESPGRVEDLFGFDDGLWQVQDEAAQLVTLFAQIPTVATVLDVCAAPGGKTCHIAQTNRVTALDLHANKLPKIEREATRLGVKKNVTTKAHDATTPIPEALGEFDVVMCDAPCSGIGTLRRHPELRYRRKEQDFAELAALQREILENAQHVVKPGGLLVYAVCSIDAREGPDQVEMFLRSHPDFTAEPPTSLSTFPSWQSYLRTLPGTEGFDGFFAARLRKMY